jgi:hypothetical protein
VKGWLKHRKFEFNSETKMFDEPVLMYPGDTLKVHLTLTFKADDFECKVAGLKYTPVGEIYERKSGD